MRRTSPPCAHFLANFMDYTASNHANGRGGGCALNSRFDCFRQRHCRWGQRLLLRETTLHRAYDTHTQKSRYFLIFTNNIKSCLLWSPVVVFVRRWLKMRSKLTTSQSCDITRGNRTEKRGYLRFISRNALSGGHQHAFALKPCCQEHSSASCS